jgi:hypothetical protein
MAMTAGTIVIQTGYVKCKIKEKILHTYVSIVPVVLAMKNNFCLTFADVGSIYMHNT